MGAAASPPSSAAQRSRPLRSAAIVWATACPAATTLRSLLACLPLLLLAGKDVKTYLHDATNWSNQKFQAALASNLSNFNVRAWR